jgi:hypothetical protein
MESKTGHFVESWLAERLWQVAALESHWSALARVPGPRALASRRRSPNPTNRGDAGWGYRNLGNRNLGNRNLGLKRNPGLDHNSWA